MPKKNLTDNQIKLAKSLDHSMQVCIDYAAPEVPSLENLTPLGMLEDLGRLNEARKLMEKTEKIVKGRLLSALSPEERESFRGENFNLESSTHERAALNQSAAKKKLLEIGEDALEECMSYSEVERIVVKRN